MTCRVRSDELKGNFLLILIPFRSLLSDYGRTVTTLPNIDISEKTN